MTGFDTEWQLANQRYLVQELEGIRLRLLTREGKGDGEPERPRAPVLELEGRLPAIALLQQKFGLSSFERDTLLLAAGPELSASFAEVCARARGLSGRASASFGLALGALDDPHWSALRPEAPLRLNGLLMPRASETLVEASLQLDEPVLHFLTGSSWFDQRLEALVQRRPALALVPSHALLEQRLRAHQQASSPSPLVMLTGRCGDVRGVAAAVAREMTSLPILAAHDIAASGNERQLLALLLRREQLLGSGAVLIDATEVSPEGLRSLLDFCAPLPGLTLMHVPKLASISRLQGLVLEVASPTPREQRQLWQARLPRDLGELPLVAEISEQFCLDAERIASVGQRLSERDCTSVVELWDLAREQTRGGLEDVAQRLVPNASWDDLVLPREELALLRELAAQVRHRAQVHEYWDVRPGQRGFGISALFSGPSGTGKTMAAEVLAHELRLDLYRIDLSQTVSKYIGETEKNLKRAFDAAEEGGAILLFDEADALFGKRTEVSDSHDRYANIEVDYLLQRMEAYRGLAILTTNLKTALDRAFLRRLRCVVEFPFPDAAQRTEMWRRVFPAGVRMLGVAPERLSALQVTGGSIRNIALNATFLAVGDDSPVTMRHVEHATRREYAKLERSMTSVELGSLAP